MARASRTHVSPVAPDAKFARVDQGVDYSQTQPYVSPGAGRVYAIGTGFAGPAGQKGANMAVYIQLDVPIRIGNRSYSQVYIAETSPLVKKGQRVQAGQPVAAGGAAEIGFARGAAPLAPLVGGLGAGTKGTSQGQDFLSFVKGVGQGSYTQTTPTPSPTQQTQPTPDQTSLTSQIVPPTYVAPPNADQAIGSGVEMPGSVSYTTHPFQASQLWQTVASSSFVSPDTQQLLMNAQMAAGTNAG